MSSTLLTVALVPPALVAWFGLPSRQPEMTAKRRRPQPDPAPAPAPKRQQRTGSLRTLFPGILLTLTLPFLTDVLTPQQRDAVAPATHLQYRECLAGVHHFLIEQQRRVRRSTDVDPELVLYFQYLEEKGVWPAIGSKTLAAMLHFFPTLGPSMRIAFPGSYRALQGWQRHMPARSRLPLPFAGLVAILIGLLGSGNILIAVMLLTGFSAYLRPTELTSLLRRQLVAPLGPFQNFVLWMHPTDQNVASKTGFFDETVVLDSAYTAFLAPFWRKLLEGDPLQPLWNVSQQAVIKLIDRTTAALGLGRICPGLYPLRHGGVSHDIVFQLRDLPAAQNRGRWATPKSLLRYQKAGRAQQMHQQLPLAVRQLTDFVEKENLLPRLFHYPAEASRLLNRFGLTV